MTVPVKPVYGFTHCTDFPERSHAEYKVDEYIGHCRTKSSLISVM